MVRTKDKRENSRKPVRDSGAYGKPALKSEVGNRSDKVDYRGKKTETVSYGKRTDKPSYGKRADKPSYEKRTERPSYENRSERPRESFVETKKDITEDISRLEGRNPIMEALKSGRTVEKLYIAKGSQEGSIRQIISMARDKGIVITEVDRDKLDFMSETKSHQGVIAVVSPYKYVEVEDILNHARKLGEKPFIVILDEIYDPHNLGSVLRTANASGAHGVIISKRRAVGLTPTVAKASAGAVEYMKVAKVTNISQTIKILKEQGVWIVGTDMDGEKTYFEADISGSIAIVIGSEGEGISRLVKENCDFIIKLPMKGEIASLNAGVAGAIVMYEIVRQRLLKG